MNVAREIKTVDLSDSAFPVLLKNIPTPPNKIFYIGQLPQNSDTLIAIVGTRKASSRGKIIAKQIAKELSSLGITIVSGLALGVDSAAHEGAIEAAGKTIAVLANGLNTIYPAQHQSLAHRILELSGCLISEYEPATRPYPNQFLERNRIISGLSLATIVIEAPDRSGSLATARNALDQGREVLVLPGPANDPNYSGSHKLIRDGARLITCSQDILEDLNLNFEIAETKTVENILKKYKIEDPNQIEIIKTLSSCADPLNVDKICNRSKLKPIVVNQSIAYLIITGIIKETSEGYML